MAAKKWEMMLIEAKALLAKSRANLFEVVTSLVGVYDDPLFRAHHGDKLDAAESHLDEFLADVDLTYAEAALMVKYYPAREQWRTTPLRTMLAESIVRRDADSRKDAPVRSTPRRIKIEDFEAVQKQAQQEAARVVTLSKEVADTRGELQKLRDDNQELLLENRELKGRISELERLVDRELQTA